VNEIHFCPTCKTRRSRIEGKPARCWLCATVIFDAPSPVYEIVETDERRRFHVIKRETGEVIARYVHRRDALRCIEKETYWHERRKAVA
jgi:hypothetical protein